MDNVSLFHSFSKVAAADNTALAAAVNKAGHVVTASDVWANEIPFCGSADSLADIKTKFADNTAFPVGTLGYDLSTSKLYQKGTEDWTEITQAAAGGYVTISYKDKPVLRWYNKAQLTLLTPENNGAPSNGFSAKYLGPAADGVGAISQFVSSTDKIVNGIVSDGYDVAVYDGTKKLTKGTSTAAADNQWMDSAYAGMILFMCAQTSKTLSMTCFEYVGDKLETSLSDIRQSIKDISDVTLKGVVASVTADENTAQKAGITVDNDVSTTPIIKFTAGSVTSGETKLVSGGAVATVTDALASRISQLEGIQHFSVVIVPEGQKITDVSPLVENTIYLVKEEGVAEGTYIEYIAFKQGETVVTEKIGSTAIDLSGYTTDAEHEALADRVTALDAATTGRVAVVEGKVSTLETTTIPAAIETAKGYTDTKIATELAETGSIGSAIKAAKEQAIASAEVTITAGTGIVVTGAGKGTTFEIAVSDDVATAATVSALSQVVTSNKTELQGNIDAVSGRVTTLEGQVEALTTGDASVDSKVNAAKTELQGKIDAINTSLESGAIYNEIAAAQSTADAAKAIADTAVQSVTRATGSSELITVTDDTDVTISLSTEVATKTDAATAASTAITTSLAGTSDGTIGKAIADAKKAGTDAQTAADAKVADVTVDGTSIVSGDAGAKKAALTTTKGVEITPNAASASTALATEASVAKALASINSVGVSYEVIPDGQTHTSITSPVKGRIYLEKETATNDADAGVYIEWMYTEKGWEQIGSTKTDHSTYASTITVNGSPKTVSESSVDLGAFASSVTAGNGVESGTVSATGALSLVLTTASTSTAGITKLDSTIADSTSETTAATPKAVKEYADTKVGDVQWFGENDLLGSKAEIVDGKLVVSEQAIKWETNTPWNSNVTKVVNNIASDASGVKVATIETDKVEIGSQMFYYTNLSEFVSDLSSLTNGNWMFGDSRELTTFIGDLSSLTKGNSMFANCSNLTTFTGDLSSLTDGDYMFSDTQLSLESVECIADTIATTYAAKSLDISWKVLPEEAARQQYVDALSAIVDKGWTLHTNQELLPLFDSEKYETGSSTVQPLDLDSEPQTIYYVVKK